MPGFKPQIGLERSFIFCVPKLRGKISRYYFNQAKSGDERFQPLFERQEVSLQNLFRVSEFREEGKRSKFNSKVKYLAVEFRLYI